MFLLRVLELGVREAPERLHEDHHGGNARPRDLRRIVQRPARQPVRRSCDLLDRLVCELEQRFVEEDRLDVPDPLPFHLDVLFFGEPLRSALRVVQHRGELSGVEVTLVEQALGRLDHRGDDAGLRDDPAHRADRAVTRPLRDLADLELEPRRTGERVAALVHRRRAGVRRLSTKSDLVTLDAERAQHDAERKLHRLEDGSLLDV